MTPLPEEVKKKIEEESRTIHADTWEPFEAFQVGAEWMYTLRQEQVDGMNPEIARLKQDDDALMELIEALLEYVPRHDLEKMSEELSNIRNKQVNP